MFNIQRAQASYLVHNLLSKGFGMFDLFSLNVHQA
jgi:hypothetical protein